MLRRSTMLRRSIILGSLLIATATFGQSLGEKTGANSALGISPTTADFIKEVTLSDMTEILTSQIALERGNEAQKAFAKQMIADHSKTSAELKQIVAAAKITSPVPTELDDAHKAKVDKLKAADGKDFVSDYTLLQRSAHKDAVSLFERYGEKGESLDLKTWATKTLPALRHHLTMADQLPSK